MKNEDYLKAHGHQPRRTIGPLIHAPDDTGSDQAAHGVDEVISVR